MSIKDYLEFLYLLQGYLRISAYPIRNFLCPIHEIKSNDFEYLGGMYNKKILEIYLIFLI
jgi:hypothetical protein